MIFFCTLRWWHHAIVFAAPFLTAFLAPSSVLQMMIAIVHLYFFGWIWAVGLFLNNRVSEQRRRNPFFFHAGMTSIILAVAFLHVSFHIPMARAPAPTMTIPLILVLCVFVIYAIYFLSASLTQAEKMLLNRESSTESTFLRLFLLNILGMMMIQPRLNRIAAVVAGHDVASDVSPPSSTEHSQRPLLIHRYFPHIAGILFIGWSGFHIVYSLLHLVPPHSIAVVVIGDHIADTYISGFHFYDLKTIMRGRHHLLPASGALPNGTLWTTCDGGQLYKTLGVVNAETISAHLADVLLHTNAETIAAQLGICVDEE